MFYVRRLISPTNLGIYPKICKFNLQQTISTKQPLDLESIIRVEHAPSALDNQIKLSESCVKHLKELGNLNKYLRISVDSGGCSGFEYKFSLDANVTDEDKFIEKNDCKVLIDKETIEFIKGATIDYHEELIRSGFRVINNPNSEQGCSCGSSFSIKI